MLPIKKLVNWKVSQIPQAKIFDQKGSKKAEI
jgi:hypothetical protein